MADEEDEVDDCCEIYADTGSHHKDCDKGNRGDQVDQGRAKGDDKVGRGINQ